MKLLLEDGSEFEGLAFGAYRPVVGEVVFTTAMSGYVESLTDPSFRGQILVLAYPLAGNYGVPAARRAGSIDAPYESSQIQVQGLVVQHAISCPSHHASARTLGDWLTSEGVPAITGIDTRSLIRRLREHGTMRGWLVPGNGSMEQQKQFATGVEMQRELFHLVAPKEPVQLGGEDGPHVLVVDVGAKDNLVRSLLKRGARVTRAPWHADLGSLASAVDGVLIGNGPGDPQDLDELVAQVQAAVQAPQPPHLRRLPRPPDPWPGRGR